MDKLMSDLKRQIIVQLNLKDLKPEDIGDDQPLFVEGLGLDSIDALQLVVALEKDHGLKLSDVEVARKAMQTINTIAAAIQKHQSLPK